MLHVVTADDADAEYGILGNDAQEGTAAVFMVQDGKGPGGLDAVAVFLAHGHDEGGKQVVCHDVRLVAHHVFPPERVDEGVVSQAEDLVSPCLRNLVGELALVFD